MIRIQLDDRPYAKHTLTLPFDGAEEELDVVYYTWTPEELAEERIKRLELAKASSAMTRGAPDGANVWDVMIERATPEEQRAIRAKVKAHLKEWDLRDNDGAPIALTEAHMDAALNWPGWLPRFYGGLFEASDGARVKNSSGG